MKKILIILLVTAAATLGAVNTAFYNDDSIRDFERGRLNGVSINEKGQLYLAPTMKSILDKKDLFIWKLAADTAGNIFAASGNKGRIYKISKKSTDIIYQDDKSSVTALHAASDGTVYAALSPGGSIIAIKGHNKSLYAKLPVTYIWDLQKAPGGGVLAATGNPAAVYHIKSTGNYRLLFTAKSENHFLCLGINRAGTVYAGSEGNGRLYRIQNNKGKAVYDSYENEISSLLVLNNGEVVFGTATPRKLRSPQNFNYKDTFPFNEQENRTATQSDTKKKKKTKRFQRNSIYKLTLEDKVIKLATFDKTSIHSLAADSNGSLYAGSGDLGVIYRIAKDGTVSRLIRLRHDRVLDLLLTPDGLYAATGNDGGVFQLDFKTKLSGEYISRIFDCQSRVTWGAIRWAGEIPENTTVSAATRTGDTDSPDDSWSNWEQTKKVNGNNQIVSPKARYLQYKLIFSSTKTGSTPLLHSVTLPFLRQNRAPIIRRLAILDHKDAAKSKKLKLNAGQNYIRWYAYDEDDDNLKYALYFRFADDPVWRLLKDNLSQNSLKISTRLFPDGKYYFRVIATDLPSNNRQNALTAVRDSTQQLFDSTPPVISKVQSTVKGDKIIITGKATDALSVIRKIKFTINAISWFSVTPLDSVYDSKSERFRITISRSENSALFNGKNMLIIRAFDYEGNFSMARHYFDVSLKKVDAGSLNNARYFKLHYRGE